MQISKKRKENEEKSDISETNKNNNYISFSHSHLKDQNKIRIKRNILLPYIKSNSQSMILKNNYNYSFPKKEKIIRKVNIHNSYRNKEKQKLKDCQIKFY